MPETDVASKIEREPYGMNSLMLVPKFYGWKPLQIKVTIVKVGNKILKTEIRLVKCVMIFTDQKLIMVKISIKMKTTPIPSKVISPFLMKFFV